MMIEFACPKCCAKLSVPENFAGKRGKCKKCGSLIDIPLQSTSEGNPVSDPFLESSFPTPEVVSSLAATPTPPPDTKACPYCGEDIKAVAIVCRFCGMNLQTGSSVRPANAEIKKTRDAHTLGPERTLWSGSPSRVAFLGYYGLGGLFVALSLVGFAVSHASPFLVLFASGGCIIVWADLFRASCVYVITTRRASEKKGILGKKYSEVNVEDIRNVVVEYDIIERLFAVGRVGISSAASSGGFEVKFLGIPEPDRIRSIAVQAKESALGSRTDE